MSVANIASLAVARETCDPQQLAKLSIFATDMLWESCSKLNFKQLSNSMSEANIASLAGAKETCDPQQLAKLAIFATNMLWESCFKFH